MVASFYPIYVAVSPQAPAAVLEATGHAYTDIGANQTSANVVALLSNIAQLVYNPDFYSSPDGWLCTTYNALLDCTWLQSDLLSYGGVVEVSGNFGPGEDDLALVFQEVETPNTSIAETYLTVRARVSLSSYFSYLLGTLDYELVIGVYDVENNQTYYAVAGASDLSVVYSTYTVNLTGVLEPGRTYIVFAGYYAVDTSPSSTADFAGYIDYVYLYVNFTSYTFSNSILAVNVTGQEYNVSLELYPSLSSIASDLNATLYIENIAGASTSPISIVGGSVYSSETSQLKVGPPPGPGYASAYIVLEASKLVEANSTLLLALKLCSGGVCAYYPILLTIDPRPPTVLHEGLEVSLAPRGAGLERRIAALLAAGEARPLGWRAP